MYLNNKHTLTHTQNKNRNSFSSGWWMITFPRHDLYSGVCTELEAKWESKQESLSHSAARLLALWQRKAGASLPPTPQLHMQKVSFFLTFLWWLITRLSLRIILVFYYIHSKKQQKKGRSSVIVSRLSGAPAGHGPAAACRCSSHSLSRRLIDFMPVHEQASAFPPAPPLFTAQHQILLVLSLY